MSSYDWLGSIQVLWLLPPTVTDMHVGLIGSSQLSQGLCHLSLCIDPAVTSGGTGPFFPKAAGILVILSCAGEKAIENG